VNFALTLAASAGASAVELLEALAIVLAVGVTRGFRNALTGAIAAAVGVLSVCLVLGPALRAGAGIAVLRVIVGSALLLFGLEWLRKGVLRVAGRRRRASSYHEFLEARDEAAALPGALGERDWAARGLAFQGVFLEGLEVGLIVLALGAAPGRLAPAVLGATCALALVAGAGFALREPLRRLPETQIKLGMGVALTAFGTYFTAEGLHARWPLAELAPLYLAWVFAATAWLAVRRLERTAPAPEPT
jgi:Ca2+/H+ antiporter, TMEM165/GDT1 family